MNVLYAGNALTVAVLRLDTDKTNSTTWLLQALAAVDTAYLAACIVIQPLRIVHCSRAVRRAGEVIPAHRTLRVAVSGNGADRHRLDRAAGDGRPLCGGVSSVPGALEERGENAVGCHRGSCACRALQSAAVVRKKGGLGDGLVHWTFGRYN